MTTVKIFFLLMKPMQLRWNQGIGPVLNYLVVDTMEEALAAATLLKEKKKDWLPLSSLQQLAATYDIADACFTM